MNGTGVPLTCGLTGYNDSLDFLLAEHKFRTNKICHKQSHSFRKLDYDVYYSLLDCSIFRIPQTRIRLIIVGFRYALQLGYSFPSPQNDVIIENKLYYIREKFPVDLTQGTPKYLFLHNGENRMLFELAKEQPQKMTKSDLQKLGFEPHGGKYYGFKVLKQTRIPEFNLLSVKIRRTKAPFLMSLSELMKKD